MIKYTFQIAVVLVALTSYSCKQSAPTVGETRVEVTAPFAMPVILIPDFSNCDRLLITAFGAEPNDQAKTTAAIAQAIDRAHTLGGGMVVIPPGEWHTGTIHLKSNVNLHLDSGAVLRFSGNPDDYLPAVHTTWEGIECYNYSPLIYAYQCENIAITGKGELYADMSTWQQWFSRPAGHMENLKRLYYLAAEHKPVTERQMVNDSAHFRPQFIQFNRCEHVLLEGVSITNSPFWTIHPYLSKHIVIRDVHITAHGHNNDGVDPDMSQIMLIENCVFDQGDDAIAVKAGRNQDAWRLNTPCKDVVIRGCTVKNGHQLVAIGSELSGGIENIYTTGCRVVDGAKLNHLLYIKTNERRGGYVKNIYLTNTTAGKIDQGILGIETDVLYQWRDLVPTLEKRLTPIHDIHIDNVHAKDVQFISHIAGQKDLPIEKIYLDHIDADTVRGESYQHTHVLQLIGKGR